MRLQRADFSTMTSYFTSPIFKDQLYGWVRAALATAGGMLVQHGYVTSGAISPELLSGLAMVLVTCALSAASKFTARQKLAVAQVSPPGISEAAIDATMASGRPIPSVMTPADQTPVVKLP